MRKKRSLVLVAFIVLGILAALILINGKFKFIDLGTKERRVKAILTGQLKLPLAPEEISSIPLYQLHLNLWDTLLESNGEPALARLIGSGEDGKALTFELITNARFSNGRTISSADIKFSIERLMSKQPGGHFNAKKIIERIEPLTQTRFTIHLKEGTQAFKFLLTIPEMGIVPKEACDAEGNVHDLSITSGAYFVEGTPTSEHIILKKNTFFSRHDLKSPTVVDLFFKRDTAALINEASDGKADFFEFYEGTGLKAFEQLKSNPDFDYLTTRPSYSIFIVANSARLSIQERIAVADLMKALLESTYHPLEGIEKRSFEMLPPETFGALGLSAPFTYGSEPHRLPKTLTIATANQAAPLVLAVVKILEKSGAKVNLTGLDTDKYDLLISGQGMNSDFPEIEFYLNMVSAWAFVPAQPSEKTMILDALHSSSREERTVRIQMIEKSLLEDARIIPLYVRSYVHMFRKGHIAADKATTYDGDVPFWKMRVDE